MQPVIGCASRFTQAQYDQVPCTGWSPAQLATGQPGFTAPHLRRASKSFWRAASVAVNSAMVRSSCAFCPAASAGLPSPAPSPPAVLAAAAARAEAAATSAAASALIRAISDCMLHTARIPQHWWQLRLCEARAGNRGPGRGFMRLQEPACHLRMGCRSTVVAHRQR